MLYKKVYFYEFAEEFEYFEVVHCFSFYLKKQFMNLIFDIF